MRKALVTVFFSTAALVAWFALASPVFDPRYQPVGYGGAYTLSKSGLAAGDAVAFQPAFDAERWSGDVFRRTVSASGDISTTTQWSAAQFLNVQTFTTRVIFTRRDDTGVAVSFADRNNFSNTQKTQIASQAVLDFLRGSRSGEGTTYRQRNGILGDILHSNLVYVGTPTASSDSDRLYVGANDGTLHAFNAKTGAEVFAYVPSTVFPTLSQLSSTAYNNNHRYFVDGGIAVEDVKFSDGSTRKVLVSGLGAGGQGYFALNITSGDASNISQTLLWEMNDRSTAAASASEQKWKELGFTYAMPAIVKIRGTSGPRHVVIVGNGYSSVLPDGVVGSGVAFLMVLDVETGAMIRAISTGQGSAGDPNGLSSPRAVDIDVDGVTDFVYAGDLNGNVWRFDFRSASPSDWTVSFSGAPLFTAKNKLGQGQSITVQPAVVPHPDSGSIVLFGTGRMLEDEDVHDTSVSTEIQSIYGIRDRFDNSPADATSLVVQEVKEFTYTDPAGLASPVQVRASSNVVVPASADGWVVDLDVGERVITPVQIRSGRVVLTTTNPLFNNQKNWLQELNYLTGGVPDIIVFDMNNDAARNANDNVDANADGDRLDLVDRVTGVYQGEGVVSGATLSVLSADEGTFFLNQQPLVQPVLTQDKGVAGGHFDVDTSSFIAPFNSGTTDGHVHEYDDKYDVVGVDFFKFLETQLHNINLDIANADQRFKLIVVNNTLSPGGRFSINKTYLAADPSTYVEVNTYAAAAISALPVYTLSGAAGTTKLTQATMSFDRNVILNKGLLPTQTGCVRRNTPGFRGEWRNGALTVWAVKVNADSSDAFTLTRRASDNAIVGITDGLLWETTIFWHWKGPCYEQDLQSAAKEDPTKTVFQYWAEQTQMAAAAKGEKEKKKKGAGKEKVGTNIEALPPKDPTVPTPFNRVDEGLSNPDRTSWKELFE